MLGSKSLFFRRGFTTAVLKVAGKTPIWREQFTMYNSWSSENPQSVLKNSVGIWSNRQVVSFTWERTRPSVLTSTRAKLSSVSSGKINDSGVSTFKICWGKRLDQMSLILLLKWSAKSSQRASVCVLEDLLTFLFVKRTIVEKRNFWLFLCLLMNLWKWEILACIIIFLSWGFIELCINMQRAVSGVIPQKLFWRKKHRRWRENKKHPRGYSGDVNDISQGMMGENSGRENEQVLESTNLGEVKLRHTLIKHSSKSSHLQCILI